MGPAIENPNHALSINQVRVLEGTWEKKHNNTHKLPYSVLHPLPTHLTASSLQMRVVAYQALIAQYSDGLWRLRRVVLSEMWVTPLYPTTSGG